MACPTILQKMESQCPEDLPPSVTCDDESDAASETSTVIYAQEPYDTFKEKVFELVRQIYPNKSAEDIVLERMKGGGFNRVIGLTVHIPQRSDSFFLVKKLRNMLSRWFGFRWLDSTKNDERFVLRTPRFPGDSVEMGYHLATLEYVSQCVPYPIPVVIAHDKTTANAISSAYMLQRRLAGQSLHDLWDTLNFEQKSSAVRQLTDILLNLNKVKSTTAGIVSRFNVNDNSPVELEAFPVPDLGVSDPKFPKANTERAQPQTTKEFLVSLCERQKEYGNRNGHTFRDAVWDGLYDTMIKLYKLGFLPNDEPFHLTHLDFQLRNLLAEVVDETNIKVTGVIDWDTAAFCPKFVSYRPPFFLWDEEEFFDELNEDTALKIPKDPEKQELKKLFETLAGDEFLKYAYGQEYVLARRMFYVLHTGVKGSYEMRLAKGAIADFDKLYPSATGMGSHNSVE